MLDKKQLVSLLLKNQQAFHEEAVEVALPQYQRNKDELISQLLRQYRKVQASSVFPNHKQIKQTSRIQPFKQEQKKLKHVIRVETEQKEEQADICKEIMLNQYFSNKNKQQFYNDYMRKITSQDPARIDQTKIQMQKNTEFVFEGPSLIDHFLKSQNIIDRNSQQSQLQANRPQEQPIYLKGQNKSYNQSTLALSKVTKLGKNVPHSPNRSFRVTEKIQASKSKSSEKEPSLSKYKVSPGRLSLSKISEIEIKVAPYGSIKHNIKNRQFAVTPKTTQHKLQYSRSNLKQSSPFIDLKPFSTPKQNQKNTAVYEDGTAKESQQKYVKEAEQKKAKVEVKKRQQIDLITRIKLDLSSEKEPNESKVHSYDYDKQKHLFDQEGSQEKKRPLIMKNEKPKISWNNVKDLWHIKDDQKFKSQIKNESQIYQQRHFKEVVSKKQLKPGQQKIGKRQSIAYQTKVAEQLKQEPNDLEELSNYEEEDDQQKSFHFFDFLKDKLTSLTKKQSQPEKSKLKSPQKQQEKHYNEPQINDQATMNAQISEHQSSSSFVKETKTIAEKGFRNVDLKNIVGQSVKRVTVNLEKIAAKNKEKSNSQLSKQGKADSKLSNNAQKVKSQNSKISKEIKSAVDQQSSFSRNISLSKQANAQREEESSVLCKKKTDSQKEQKEPSSLNHLQPSQKKIKYDKVPQEKPVNLSVDFFAKCQLQSEKNGSEYSKPSTVQKIDSHSADKSDLLNQLNFQDHKDDSLAQKLFQQNDQLRQSNIKIDKMHQVQSQPANKSPEQQKMNESSELQLSYQTSIIKKPQRIDINLSDLQQISLSEDAISFSKLENASDYESSLKPKVEQVNPKVEQVKPPQVKAQIQNQLKKQITKQQEKPHQASRKLGKVKRIEINLDESSSDQQLADQEEQNQSCDINLDEIKDYDSDEESVITPTQTLGHSKQRNVTVLPPVVEEELEESEFNKLNAYKPSVSFKKRSEHSQQKEESMRQLEQQFLKDFPLNKVESQVQQYSAPIRFKKVSSMKEGKQKIKIKIKPTDSKFTNIHSERQANESIILDQSIKDQKLLLQDIKGDIEKLKNKIQSSAILEISKRQEGKRSTNGARKIEVDLSLNKSNGDGSILNSLSKIEKDRSFIVSQKKGNQSVSSKGNTKSINFDEINESNGRQLFESFRQDLNSLKKKMQSDALQGY